MHNKRPALFPAKATPHHAADAPGDCRNKTVAVEVLSWSAPDTAAGLRPELGKRLFISEKNFPPVGNRPVFTFETPSQSLGLVLVVDERLLTGDPRVESNLVEGAPDCFFTC